MRVIIIGKNSSIYSLIRPNILNMTDPIELDRESVFKFDFNRLDTPDTKIIIFSGVSSDDLNLLKVLEDFHLSLCGKISKLLKTRLIYISSSAVYGEHKEIFLENDECIPSTNYGKSKRKIEQMYASFFRSNLLILRLGNVIGYDSVSLAFSKKVDGERFLDCRPDGSTPMRTYVDSQILAKSISLCIQENRTENCILNVGRERPMSMFEAMKELNLSFTLRESCQTRKNIIIDTSNLHAALVSKRL